MDEYNVARAFTEYLISNGVPRSTFLAHSRLVFVALANRLLAQYAGDAPSEANSTRSGATTHSEVTASDTKTGKFAAWASRTTNGSPSYRDGRARASRQYIMISGTSGRGSQKITREDNPRAAAS